MSELKEMTDKEYALIEELVLSVKKLNTSLALVADAVYDVRASMNRVWAKIED